MYVLDRLRIPQPCLLVNNDLQYTQQYVERAAGFGRYVETLRHENPSTLKGYPIATLSFR